MNELIADIVSFIEVWNIWIVVASVVMFAGSLATVPWLVSTLPADYFTHRGRLRLSKSSQHPAVRLTIMALKNLLGALLLVAGFIMLFTPGQGLLTILFGLTIMNYPGKYRLECRIIGKPMIFDTVNKMREKQGKDPLLPPEAH